MNLTHRQVEIINAVISSGSVTQASVMLHTSQPSISRDLKEIQKLLGFELFKKSGRSLQPTSAAMRLYAEVRRSYVGLSQINNCIEEIKSNLTGRINLACLPAYATTLLPLISKSFLIENQNLHLSIHSFEQSIIANGLISQHYDIGLVEATKHISHKPVHEITVGEEVCIIPERHPLAAKTVLTPYDFQGVDFISFSETDFFGEEINRIFDNFSVRRNSVIDTTTATAVCALVASGLGLSIVNPVTALYFVGQGLVMRRFSVSVPYTIGIYLSKNVSDTKTTYNFIQHCKKVLHIMKENIRLELKNT